ncbi:unnamed protein product [Protopolystoma xenopodis]|uniref:Uncharacterized protein n=1 Tax=Protopolystoma xenopodis TaxID=117903 RepID=A0A3S5BX52_9PLAT|nr:unnamed protein product [Protopolystoma xenopodis]
MDFEWGRGGMASQAQREILARWNLVADFLQDSEFGPEGIDEPLSLEPLYDILCTLTLLASSQVVQPTGRLADMVETHRVRVCKHLETLREAYAHLSSQPISNDKQRIGCW